MKRILSIGFWFFLPALMVAQDVNFEDGFSDRDISGWSGDTDDFIFVAENGNVLLQQDTDGAGVSYLSIPSANANGYWEFFVRFDGFGPSDGNKVEIYLMSDRQDLTSALNGYKLRGGENGSGDVFRLFRITNGSEDAEVLAGTTDISGGGDFRVKVTRNAPGNWILEVGNGYAGVLTQEAAGTDNTYTTTSYFGFKNTYSSTRADRFYYDFKIDIPPVEVIFVSAVNNTEIDVGFSREINFTTVQNSDFTLNPGALNPSSVTQQDAKTARLTFSNPIPGGENELFLSNIDDAAGETTLADTTVSFVIFDSFTPDDVVINEIMKDPPDGAEEYIELINTSSKYLNLKGWELGDNNSLATLSNQDFALLPDSFVVVSFDTAALYTFYGTAHYLEASLPAFNNTADQVRLYDETGAIVDSLEYTPVWGGEDVALERRDVSVSATFRENWGDSPAAVFGTPGVSNQIAPDEEPPAILDISIPDNQTLIIVLSERLESESAETISNYLLSQNAEPGASLPPLPGVSSVTQTAPDTLELTLDAPLEEYAGTWTLEADNLTDIFGNTTDDEIDFNYFEIFTAKAGQVAINELMYDPGDGFSEFVELYNQSDSSFDLQDWSLNDNTGDRKHITSSSLVLPAGEYMVLVPDSTTAKNFPGISFINMFSRFPSLNNSTDAIVIRNQNGTLIDSLTYSSSWGGEEVSLERRSVEVAGTFRENWGSSPSQYLASPGRTNEIEPDNKPPGIVSVFISAVDSIRILFDERIDSALAANPVNYSISPALAISEIIYRGNEVSLVPGRIFSDGERFTLTIENQQDIFGNVLESASFDLEYILFSSAQPKSIIVNEILYRRTDAESPEFVEIYNNTSLNFDLGGWSLSDASSSVYIPDGTSIRSGEYLVLTDTEAFANELEKGMYLPGFSSLNDNGDAVVLKKETGQVIDSLFYRETWGGNQPGVSLERKDPGSASNDAANWTSSISDNGNSAGGQSSVYEIDETPPEIIFAKLLADENVLVVFSEFVDLTHPGTEVEVNEQEAAITGFEEENANIVIIGENEISPGKPLNIHFTIVADIRGNTGEGLSVEASQPLAPGGVVINEILFDPLDNPDDNLPDQTEYIELYNREEYAVSLEGFYLHDEPDEENEVRSILPVSSTFKWIPPGGYMLVYAEDQTFSFEESQLVKYFKLEGMDERFITQIDRSSLSLASSSDAIYLADSTGTVIDSVFYDESWHNPNIYDTDGISLERISPNEPGNASSNWSSSTDVRGGTPGTRNSIHQEAGQLPEGTGITFTPNPFSPDDDGFEDNLFINYSLNESDYLLRIRIFDRYGREVRKLADGKPAGFEGSLIWDGLTDERTKNRVGFYIIFFEAYNSSTGKSLTVKKTVVLARKF